MEVTVRRSAWKMWLLAVAGVPLLVVGFDFALDQRLLNAFGVLVYGSGGREPFELRDVMWAVFYLVVGLGFTGFGLKELVAPRSVLRVEGDNIHIRLRGPFRRAATLEVEELLDAFAGEVEETDRQVPALFLVVSPAHDLPLNPWGARWMEQNSLAIFSGDWDPPAWQVADMLRGLER